MYLVQGLQDNPDLLIRVYFVVSTLLVLLAFKNKTLFTYTLYGKRLKYFNRTKPFKFLVSKSFFSNFYLLGLVLNCYLFYREHREFLNLFRIMYVVHLSRRLFEQVFLFTRLPKQSMMHLFAYLFGLRYQLLSILSFYVATAFSLNTPSSFVPFKLSLSLNFFSQLLQFYSHCKIAQLRSEVDEDRSPYRVPRFFPYNFVLCPHYLAEILIYLSFCCNLNMLFCFVFVTFELTFLALSNRKWYRDNFSRSQLLTDKVLVPFLF